jgi:hypothetical protein
MRSVVVLAWPLFLFWTAQNAVHLAVWMEDDVVVYPSETTSDLSLPLTFEGDSARSATVLTVRIVNDGKQVIGSAGALWSLRLRALNATHIAAIGDPETRPADVIVNVRDASGPSMVALEMGALQPKADVRLPVLLVNVPSSERPRLELESNLEGLPRPREVRWSSPQDLLANRLFPWAILGMFGILVGARVLELNKKGEWGEKKNLASFIATQLLFFGLFAVFIGLFVTKGLAWLMYRMG